MYCHKSRPCALDVGLFKKFGIYQLADPTAGVVCNVNAFRLLHGLMGVCTCYGVVLPVMALLRPDPDFQRTSYALLLIVNWLLFYFKVYTLVVHGPRLWHLLDAVNPDVLVSVRWHGGLVEYARNLSLNTRRLTVVYTLASVAWVLWPAALGELAPGLQGSERNGVFNMWHAVPRAVYDSDGAFYLVYAIESLLSFYTSMYMYFFDCLIFCVLGLTAQRYGDMAEVATRYLEHLPNTNDGNLSYNISEIAELQLKLFIGDHQLLTKYVNAILKVFRPAITFQFLVSSTAFCFLIVDIIILKQNGKSSCSLQLLKEMFFLMNTFYQLVLYSTPLERILQMKERLNFSLYASKWTNRNMTYKKLLLLAMAMNSCNRIFVVRFLPSLPIKIKPIRKL